MTKRTFLVTVPVGLLALSAFGFAYRGDYTPAALVVGLAVNIILNEVLERLNLRIQEEMQKQLALKDEILALKDERIAIAHRALGWDEKTDGGDE